LFIGNCSGTTGRGIAFVPPYQYTVEPTAGLKEKIEAGAGATLNVPGTFSPHRHLQIPLLQHQHLQV